MKEIFKEIRGYEGFYKVSNFGYVVSIRSGKKLKSDSSHNYERVTLSVDGVVKRFFVHRLVCEAFLDNKEGKPIVNHKDFNKRNNNLRNLEWCTPSENSIHAEANGLNNNARAKAVEAAARIAEIKSNKQIRGLIGDRVIDIHQSQCGGKMKRFVKFKCKCGNIYNKRADSVMVKRGGICSECKG